MSSARLGPVTLIAPVGEGGMGEVWRGRHDDGVDVAVKVLTRDLARQRAAHDAFRHEVRAVARLDHPGIVTVLDHGEVDAAAAAASDRRLVAGSPYLVMELASGGSLHDLRGPLGWADMRAVLVALLEALAHAHAHGLVHRDLKPANVLVSGPSDLRPGLKLTDFGIARVMDASSDEADRVAGTPDYMAPEQLLGQVRDCGPWTDLYALGCLTWRSITGRGLFPSRRGVALVRAHVLEEPGPLAPVRPMPPGLEAWLRRLLHKDRHARFACAADALFALRALPRTAGADDSRHPRLEVAHAAPSLTRDTLGVPLPRPAALAATMRRPVPMITVMQPLEVPPPLASPDRRTIVPLPDETAIGDAATRLLPRAGLAAIRARPPTHRDVPPIPPTWRSPVMPAQPVQLLGAGLGLYGLRTGRMVGRELERDRLWTALSEVAREGRPRAVLLRGETGLGKSRLARWLAVRAHEVGAATALWVDNAPGDGPVDAVRRMLQRVLACEGLWRAETVERAVDHLEAHGVHDTAEAERLADLVGTPADGRPLDRAERYQVLARLLARMAATRPVVLVLEDVQHGSDTLGLAEHVLRGEVGPVLLLVTVGDDALAEHPDAATRLATLVRRDEVTALTLEPLAAAAHEELVRELLRLEPELAVKVAERTVGSPLFAVQLVGDWVQRGVLEVGTHGFRLKPGETAPLPDGVHAVWSERLDRALHGMPPRLRIDLERAAVLGLEVEAAVWQEACGAGDEVARIWLVDRLLRAQLLVPRQGGWGFVHGMLRESLLRRAEEEGRLLGHHRACADVLQRRRRAGEPVVAERLGMHLMQAGRAAEAVDLLLEALPERKLVGYGLALALAATCEEALVLSGLPQTDPRWVTLALERGNMHRIRGELDEARVQLARAAALARTAGARALLKEVIFMQAVVELNARRHADMAPYLDDLYALAVEDEDAAALGRHAHLMADFVRSPAERARLNWEAVRWFEQVGDHGGLANTFVQLAQRASEAWDLEQARQLFARAIEEHEICGMRPRAALALNGMGEVLRHLDRPDEAAAMYQRALDLLESVGDSEAYYPLMNLGILALERRDWLEAWQRLERGRRMIGGFGRSSEVGIAYLLMTPCAAALGEWEAFDAYLAQGRQLRADAPAERDVAAALELASELCAADPERARRCRAWARDEWLGAGRPDRAAALDVPSA